MASKIGEPATLALLTGDLAYRNSVSSTVNHLRYTIDLLVLLQGGEGYAGLIEQQVSCIRNSANKTEP